MSDKSALPKWAQILKDLLQELEQEKQQDKNRKERGFRRHE